MASRTDVPLPAGTDLEAASSRPSEAARSGGPALPRIAVVVNGNAKSVTAEVIETLDQILDSGDLFVSRSVEESEGIARILVDRGYGTILTGGGDGTFTSVVTAVVNEAKRRSAPIPRFGLLRLGTGNSLAWVLGASGAGEKGSGGFRGLAVDLSRLRADAGSRWLRLVEAEGVLSPFCGFGIDAEMLKDYTRVKGLLARGPLKRIAPGMVSYAIAATTKTLPSYFVRRTPHCRVINTGSDAVRVGEKGSILGAPIRKGGVIYEGPAKLACVATIPYYGFGLRMFPYAEDRPDRMQLRVTNLSPVAFVSNFQTIWRGEYEDLESTFDFFVDDITIEMDPPTAFQIGGDVRGDRKSIRVRLTEPIRIVDFYAPPRG
ncbi:MULTISPECIES: diacylglycerol/lipid kinase family protein [Polyangium]|uniref:Diacylglycerol kinase family protein n=1 Tax=Polyangium sorediatum TaxID=889274 RepID=A0ABT6NSN1_9BACT|nr:MULTISPECIES: diacylglycerol kinase family protein [Polyangium]MDI1431336.1 diacylglycerol kinase family protein [Polyangium sorediatum]